MLTRCLNNAKFFWVEKLKRVSTDKAGGVTTTCFSHKVSGVACHDVCSQKISRVNNECIYLDHKNKRGMKLVLKF